MQYNSGDEVIFAEQYPSDLNFVDEHERIQKKVFTNWFNYYVPNSIKEDLITELKDGTKLIKLIEALTGDKLSCEKGKKLKRVHFISNINKVLNYLERKKIKLVNINPTDIVDGNSCIILGLIWTIILKFQIHQIFNTSNQDISSQSYSKFSPSVPTQSSDIDKKLNKEKDTIKILLEKFNRKFDLSVKNFKSDWKDGFNILRIIDKLIPNCNAVKKGLTLKNNLERLNYGIDLASEKLGVKKLIDAEDIDLNNPDEKSIMTYLVQFLQKEPIKEFEIIEPSYQKIKPSNNYQASQMLADSSKLFEDQLTIIEKEMVEDFIRRIFATKITFNNIKIHTNQFNNIEPIFSKNKNNFSNDTQKKWSLIKEELILANQLEKWIPEVENYMKNYDIPCSYDQCQYQLKKHENFFDDNLKIKKQVLLIEDFMNKYNQIWSDSIELRNAYLKASSMWKDYEKSKNCLLDWLNKADELLSKSNDMNNNLSVDHLNNLKIFFDNKQENKKILLNFVKNFEDVLSTLPNEKKNQLESTKLILTERFYNINNKSSQQLIKNEFESIKQNFFDKVKNFKNIPKNNLNDFELSINQNLDDLKNLGATYYKNFNDKSLLEEANNYCQEWNNFKTKVFKDYDLIKKNTFDLLKQAESDVNFLNNNNLNSSILEKNKVLFDQMNKNFEDLKDLQRKNPCLEIESDLIEIEDKMNYLLDKLNNVVENKILDWCKLDKKINLPSDNQLNKKNGIHSTLQLNDFYSKLVNEFENYDKLILNSQEFVKDLNSKLNDLSFKKEPFEEIASNYKLFSNKIEDLINKILNEVRSLNTKLLDHNYLEEIHANEILKELDCIKRKTENQYKFFLDDFSKEMLNQLELFRSKCDHCEQITDLKKLLVEVKNLRTSLNDSFEKVNLNEYSLQINFLNKLEDLLKLIDEKYNKLLECPIKEEKRVIITTELMQKKTIEEININKQESSKKICEMSYKNYNPFYQEKEKNIEKNFTNTTENLNSYQTFEKTIDENIPKEKNDFEKKIKTKTYDEVDKNIEENNFKQTNDFYDLEVQKENQKIDEKSRKEKKRIEEEMRKEKEAIKEKARLQKEQLEEEATKEKEKIDEKAIEEKEKIMNKLLKEKKQRELEKLIEKDNNKIKELNQLLEEIKNLISTNEPETTSTENLKSILSSFKELLIQTKYIKDTQINDKGKLIDFEKNLNGLIDDFVKFIEQKFVSIFYQNNTLNKTKKDDHNINLLSLDENIKKTESLFDFINDLIELKKKIDEINKWINNKINDYSNLKDNCLKNIINYYEGFLKEFEEQLKEVDNLNKLINDKINSYLPSDIPEIKSLEKLKNEYIDICKESINKLLENFNKQILNIEENAKNCQNLIDFEKIIEDSNNLKNNDLVIYKENLLLIELVEKIKNIDEKLNELNLKLEKILDDKAVEFINYNDFVLEPNEFKNNFDSIEDKAKLYIKLKDEIENYKNMFIENDFFLESLRKKLNEINLSPIEDAMELCNKNTQIILNQFQKLQNSLKDLNERLSELGYLQELKAKQPFDDLNNLKNEYDEKFKLYADEFLSLIKDQLKNINFDNLENLEQIDKNIFDLENIYSEFKDKTLKLNIENNPNALVIEKEILDLKDKLLKDYSDLENKLRLEELKAEEERNLKEKEVLRKLEEERIKKEEMLKKLEEERIKKEKEILKKLEEEEKLKKEEERIKKEEERLKKEKERLRKEDEKLKKIEKEKLLKEQELIKKLEDEKNKSFESFLSDQSRNFINKDDFLSANNLAKIENISEDQNLKDKKIKKLVVNKHNENNITEPKYEITKKRLPETILMENLESNNSTGFEYDKVDWTEPIQSENKKIENILNNNIDLDELKEYWMKNNSCFEKIVENLKDFECFKDFVSKLKDFKNINENDNIKSEDLKPIYNLLENIFSLLKNNPDDETLTENINLYTEIVTEYDKFDNLINDNNEFLNEIKKRLKLIEKQSLDERLNDYRVLLNDIINRSENMQTEVSKLNDSISTLKFEKIDCEKSTLLELQKLQKLCEDHIENSIEDIYIGYIPKLKNIEQNFNNSFSSNDLINNLNEVYDLKDEINDKIQKLSLSNSPLIRNLLSLLNTLQERIKNKLESLNDTYVKQNSQDFVENYNYEIDDESINPVIAEKYSVKSLSCEKIDEIELNKNKVNISYNELLDNEGLKKYKKDVKDKILALDENLKKTKQKIKGLENDHVNFQTNESMYLLTDLTDIIQCNEEKKNLIGKFIENFYFYLNKYLNNNLEDNLLYKIKESSEKNNSADATAKEILKNVKIFKNNFNLVCEIWKDCDEKEINNLKWFEELNEFITENSINDSKNNNLCESLKDFFDKEKVNEEIFNCFIRKSENLISDLKDEDRNHFKEVHSYLAKNFYEMMCTKRKYSLDNLKFNFLKHEIIKKLVELPKKQLETEKLIIDSDIKKLIELGENIYNNFFDKALLDQALNLSKEWENVKNNFIENNLSNKNIESHKLLKNKSNSGEQKNSNIIKKIEPISDVLKKETKEKLLKINSQTFVKSPKLKSIQTQDDLLKLLKEMVLKLDNLSKNTNFDEDSLKSYMINLKEICNHSKTIRENESQLNNQLDIIDYNLEIIRQNLINILTSNILEKVKVYSIDHSSYISEIKPINFDIKNSEQNLNETIQKLNSNLDLENHSRNLNELMNSTTLWVQDFKHKLDYLSLRTFEELLDEYKLTILSIEIQKAKILDCIEVCNLKLKECNQNTSLDSSLVVKELDYLKSCYIKICEDLFANYAKDYNQKLENYTKKCSNCGDHNEFEYILNEIKEYKILDANRIYNALKNTQSSLDKLLNALSEIDKTDNKESLKNDLSESCPSIYACEICIEDFRNCVPNLEETNIPEERKERSKNIYLSNQSNDLNMSENIYLYNEQKDDNNNFNATAERNLQFEVWIESMCISLDSNLEEKNNADKEDFQKMSLILKNFYLLRQELKKNLNHSALNNKTILNKFRMLYLISEKEIVYLKKLVENLRKNQPINLPVTSNDGSVNCQNGIHFTHLPKIFNRNYLKRLMKFAVPIYLILFLLFGISILTSFIIGDCKCFLKNFFRRIFSLN